MTAERGERCVDYLTTRRPALCPLDACLLASHVYPVTVDDLLATLSDREPPPGLNSLLRATWLDAHGDWNGAHQIAQDDSGSDAAWIHAYLHRKEGDAGNAAYWYRCASQQVASGSLDEEWRLIVSALLSRP